MKTTSGLWLAAMLAAGATLEPGPMYGLSQPRRPQRLPHPQYIGDYHKQGNPVLMDWDLPKGKRAKRRARTRPSK